jgi:altronate dehydratase
MANPSVIVLHPEDQVAVAARDLLAGDPFEDSATESGRPRAAREPIPAGHKVARHPIAEGERVRKYGSPIGRATRAIAVGEHVHSHNLVNEDLPQEPPAATSPPPPPQLDAWLPSIRTFDGYVRPSGKVGTRNYIAVVATVNCSASVSQLIARHFDAEALSAFPYVDGVIALTHEGGCGMAYGGGRHRMLARVLSGMLRHPNVAGCVLIGLGCEQATADFLVENYGVVPLHGPDGRPLSRGARGVPIMTMQSEGGTRRSIQRGCELVRELLPEVDRCRRQPVGLEHLMLGLECGGSDGYSGISANPAIGIAADLCVATGGTAILSETTELVGAEHTLAHRARSPAVAKKLYDRIDWWRWYTGIFGEQVDHNPSVGNKAGGLTTIAEKSLGAAAKGGSTALEDVYEYAEPVTARGFVIMDTPGFDPASVTGMVAGGANVVLFSTGRGSCFGCKPTPSIKVTTTTDLFLRMDEDMDFDGGEVLSGKPLMEVGADLFRFTIDVASGRKTKSEQQGIGDYEFVPWTVGAML